MTRDEYTALKIAYQDIGKVIKEYEQNYLGTKTYVELAEKICEYNSTSLKEVLFSGRKQKYINIKRQIAYVLDKTYPLTKERIGNVLEQERSGIYNHVNRYQNLLDTYPEERKKHEKLLNFLEYEK